MTAPTFSRDPFEAALAQHLKAGAEPVPPRLVAAVDGALGAVTPEANTRWAGDLLPRTGITMAAFSTLVVGLLVVVGTYFLLGGPTDGQPSDPAAPPAASGAPPEDATAPEPSLEAIVLEDGTVLDPELVAALEQPVGDTELEPTPMPSPRPALDPVVIETRLVAALPDRTDPAELVRGPLGGAHYIDRATDSVWRVSTTTGEAVEIVRPGDTPRTSTKTAVGMPVRLAAAGPDVIIVNDAGRPWRWQPSNDKGAGTLARLKLQDDPALPEGHGPVTAYDPQVGEYRLYVVDPANDQILRYQQTFDGSAFAPPSPYLASATTEVDDFEQLHIDFDVYALFDNTLRRHQYGKWDGAFALEPMPDENLRPGHAFRLVDGSGRASSMGRLYLYDAQHGRIVAFSKVDGRYVAQWMPAGGEMADVRGMYIIENGLTKKRDERKNDTLVWVTPEGVYEAKLKVPEPT